jgi:hypothetical protein
MSLELSCLAEISCDVGSFMSFDFPIGCVHLIYEGN